MGLDMYLTAEKFMSEHFDDKDADRIKSISAQFPELGDCDVQSVIAKVGYWRKANAIHKWFVENTQDGVDECQRTNVSTEQLQSLLDVVNQVIADPSKANELLPPELGFFFGSVDIDDCYTEDLELTKKILEKAILLTSDTDEKFNGWELFYQSSW